MPECVSFFSLNQRYARYARCIPERTDLPITVPHHEHEDRSDTGHAATFSRCTRSHLTSAATRCFRSAPMSRRSVISPPKGARYSDGTVILSYCRS
jgi:hypothetical protein